MKQEAILNLYPTVKTVETDIDGNIKPYDSDGNLVSVDMSAVEIKATELQLAQDNAKAQKEADALAGNNKLLALGLSQAEVTAMTGYTPPAEV